MIFSYKDDLDQETQHFEISNEDANENTNEIRNQIIKICSGKNYPNSNELEVLYNYCKTSKTDEVNVNLYLFNLVFVHSIDDLKLHQNISALLMNTIQFSSFESIFFLNLQCINCLVFHIINKDELSKYATLFLINLLHKTQKRIFLKETAFFDLFQHECDFYKFEEIIFAFFSQSEEINQDVFDMLYKFISMFSFSTKDVHQLYRFLKMILSFAEKNIKIGNIDAIINNNIPHKENFIIEITLILIQYSENPQFFFDYVISNLRENASCDAIVKASLSTFSSCWNSFNHEQKTSVSLIISSILPNMSYSAKFLLVSFLCDVKNWEIFNNIMYFEEIFNFLTNKELSLRILETIHSFLSSDFEDENLSLKVINLLFQFYDDLNQIANSTDKPSNSMAQILVNIINDANEN